MFRMRRYRVFLIFAIIAIGALYHFTSLGELESAGAASVEGLKNFGQEAQSSVPPPITVPEEVDNAVPNDPDTPAAIPSVAESRIATVSQIPEVAALSEVLATRSTSPSLALESSQPTNHDDTVNPKATPVEKHTPAIESTPKTTNKTSKPVDGPADPIVNGGGGRLEIIAETGLPKIHWSQMPEHFPVPTESLIQLPTGKPKVIPKIQHDFETESAEEKVAREEKRDTIKKAFSFSWAGYKQKAWMQDELSPVSGKFRNPFCQWGATLVDTLDTLYMMGLHDEFEEAVEAVKEIDFTTSPRNDIPLFETVIRYLGGLVAAYDISDGEHRILLDKAVELAEILMGAFDTPNRMPMTFYLWKPTFASQPHRAKTRVVLAELGSLSVEFTRLAQITKEAKYYDAIARITNEFEIWQNNTKMPGLWPNKLDASGCQKPDMNPQTVYDPAAMNGATNAKPLLFPSSEAAQSPKVTDHATLKKTVGEGVGAVTPGHDRTMEEAVNEIPLIPSDVSAITPAQAAQSPPDVIAPAAVPDSGDAINPKGALGKRSVDDKNNINSHLEPSGIAAKAPECEPQGLASPPYTPSEDFGIGGQADSTYEYLPKQYMLLGGLEDKYRTMYEASADTITKDLLYRTMIPDEKRRILHPGIARAFADGKPIDLKPEGSHLGCFAGGMYAVGAKIFGREGDMKIAKELTDGCVWAYEATSTGIMPDSYLALQCPDPVDCRWNETYYHEQLDPYGYVREQNRALQQQAVLEAEKKVAVKQGEETTAQVEPTLIKDDSPISSAGVANSIDHTTQANPGQSPQQSLGDKPAIPDQAKGDDDMPKSTEATTEKPAPVPEQSAEHGASLPAGGASVEQPVSPPGGGAFPLKSRNKRQLGDIEAPPAAPLTESGKDTITTPTTGTAKEPTRDNAPVGTDPVKHADNIIGSKIANGTKAASAPVPAAAPYIPPPIPTREEYVKAKIRDERLPAGMTKVTGPKYLLRPEAIESVFIMYRATGDVYWREKGWEMFQSIEKHTLAAFGGSAISDVTRETPTQLDEMESFWLAETLKYFYLLFSEPSLVSLDEYVLNTEAHAFKRPT